MTPVLAQRSRSDGAFERMYKRHAGDVYRSPPAIMRTPADAEDVTQTTFLNAYRSYIEKGNRPEKPQNWLIAIAHNVCRQRFRQSARRPAEVSFEDDIADAIVDEDALTGQDIRRALSHLAFNQRAALVMRELEGRSYGEIAQILDLSTSAVETLIFRARRALREQLEGSLTCGEAEFAISRQLDGRLSRHERGQLRAHLRECSECATFARSQRAQRGALKTLALVPVPGSLGSFFGGGGAAVGTAVAIKAAATVAAGLVIGGVSYEGVRHAPWRSQRPAPAAERKGGITPSSAVVPSAPREQSPQTLAPGGKSRLGPAKAAPRSGKAKAQSGSKAHAKHFVGDASVASRHVGLAHPTHPAHPVTSHRLVKPRGKGKHQLPGPFDTKPPGSHKP